MNLAESSNTKLVLQLTSQSKYINELLDKDKDQISQPSTTIDDPASHANVNLLSDSSDK